MPLQQFAAVCYNLKVYFEGLLAAPSVVNNVACDNVLRRIFPTKGDCPCLAFRDQVRTESEQCCG